MKQFVLFFIALCFLCSAHGQNVALTATPSASASSAGSYGPSNWNNGLIGPQYYFGWLGTDPSFSQPAWLMYEWSTPQSFNTIVFHPPSWTNPGYVYFAGSAEVHYWDDTAWVNHHTFTVSLPGMVDTVQFADISTNKLRVTNFTILGQHNPGWDEIEVFHIQPAAPVLDISLCAITEPSGTLTMGTPVTVMVSVCNTGTDTITDPILIYYDYNQSGVHSFDVIQGPSLVPLLPGQHVNGTFSSHFLMPVPDSAWLCAWVAHPGDTDPSNDTLCVTLYTYTDPGIGIHDEMRADEGFVIYPNPSSGMITLERNHAQQALPWALYDSYGRKVARGTIPEGSLKQYIHLPDLAPGLYLLHAKDDHQPRMHKVMIR